MADAFMVRGSQRQKFQDELHRLIYDLEEKYDDWANNRVKAYFYLTYLIGQYLVGELATALAALPSPTKYESVARDTLVIVIERCRSFSRATEEQRYMLAEFMMWLTESALHPEQASLVRKEITDPQTIFHAHSATSDVDPEGDGHG